MKWEEMPKAVKERYTWRDGILYQGKSQISSYYIKPVKRLKYETLDRDYCVVRYLAEGEGDNDKVLFEKIIDVVSFSEQKSENDSRCIEFKRTSRKELSILLQLQVKELEKEEWYIDSIGWHKIEGQWAYCIGNQIFVSGKDSEKVVHISSEVAEKYVLKYDIQKDSKTIVQAVNDLILLENKPVNICILYLVLGLMRTLLFSVDIPPKFLLYIYGDSQTYKSTLAKYIFDIYSRRDGSSFALEDLTSSESALQSKILEFRDCVFILDDLSPGVDKSDTRKKNVTVNNFIRTAANCESRLTKTGNHIQGKNYECSMVITAEYMQEVESIVNRTIIIDLNKYPLTQHVLDFFDNYPILPVEFTIVFLKWAVDSAEKICEWIPSWWKLLRNRTKKGDNPRINDSFLVLKMIETILALFFETYGFDKTAITKRFDEAEREIKQNEMETIIRLRSEKKEYDIAEELVKLLNGGKLNILPSVFEGDAYIKKNNLWISPIYLCRELQKVIVNESLSTRQISLYLAKNNLLKLDNSKDNTKKGANKKRYFCIDLQLLEDITNMAIEIED